MKHPGSSVYGFSRKGWSLLIAGSPR